MYLHLKENLYTYSKLIWNRETNNIGDPGSGTMPLLLPTDNRVT